MTHRVDFPLHAGGVCGSRRWGDPCEDQLDALNPPQSPLPHIIFSTKGRRRMIADTWRDNLHAYIGGIIKDMNAVPFGNRGSGRSCSCPRWSQSDPHSGGCCPTNEAWLVRVDSFLWGARLRLAGGICGFYSQSIASRKGGAIHRKSGRASSSEKFRGRVSRDTAI